MNHTNLPQEIFNAEQDNLQKLAALFPAAVKDGLLDIAALKEELGQFEEVTAERYELSWAGKRNAKRASQSDVAGRTLKYIPEDSKDADTTQNLYIEGDNLEVLKLLRQNYYGAVKMIYIDPPYNTGNDFVYRDDFSQSRAASDEAEGETVDGERMVVNQKSGNRFHANWLNMMYPRLRVAKDLLREDGVIFISIDENEFHRLKSICDEIFGQDNYICDFVWQNKKGGGNDSIHTAIEHEYVIAYSRNKDSVSAFYEQYTEEYLKRYKEEDEQGKYYWDTFKRKAGKQYYPIECPDGTILQFDEDGNPISWLRSQARFFDDLKIGDTRIVKVNNSWSVQFKQRLPKGKTPRSIFSHEKLVNDKGTTSTGADDVYQYFNKEVFSNPKPVELLEFLCGFALSDGDIALDFFSGSGTTAEAIMNLNADGGMRHYIVVQLQEDLDKTLKETPSNKRLPLENAIQLLDEMEKPHFITELGKERIRRAGEKIKAEVEAANAQLKLGEEPKQVPDIGFRVFRTADTNIRWTHEALEGEMTPLEVTEMLNDKNKLDFMPGYTDIDVVYEVLLRQRDIPLSAKVEKLDIGQRTYLFADAYVVCLDETVTVELAEALAAVEPTPIKYVFRDSAFEDNISLKDETVRRLEAYIARNSGEQKKAYTVEFI